MRYILIFFIIAHLLSCTTEQSEQRQCTTTVLNLLEMNPYSNQDVACKNFLILFELDNEQYFVETNNCADMLTIVLDCDGNDVCQNNITNCAEISNNIFQLENRIGIVGIAD